MSPEDAVEYLHSIWDEQEDFDLDDVDNVSLAIIPPPPDAASDCEDVDDDVMMVPTTDKPTDVAGTVEIMLPREDDASACNKESSLIPPHWKKVKGHCPQYSKTPEAMSANGVQEIKQSLGGKTVSDIFFSMTNDILDKILEQTLLYSQQQNHHSFMFSKDELLKFIGILLISGYHTLPRERMYWDRAPDCNVEIVAECMSRNRFQEIKKNLHFNDNNSIDSEDKYYKVRPLYELANSSLMKYGVFCEKLTIDERMVKYYGRHSLKMYIKGKPVKFGYKLWMLCGHNGYPFQILPYQGKKEKDNEPLSTRVVERLTSVIEHPNQHAVYMDNFFSSYGLAVRMKKKGFFMTGTVRENRIGKCPLELSSSMKKKDRGTSDKCFDTNNEIGIVRWNDNKVVTVVTNFESLDAKNEVQRRTKGSRTNVPIPECIKSYNKYKNGVDLFDSLMAVYGIQIRGKKWYFALFTNILDTMVLASWKLYTTAELGTYDFLTFRRE